LPGQARAEQVTVFAAASTTSALEEAVGRYEAAGGGAVRLVFAASSILAKQIAQGAPADLFLSANMAWMDDLAGRGALEPGSLHALLANRLVLIVPEESTAAPAANGALPLPEVLGTRPLAIADPAHVPAGIYAEAALRSLGLWEALAGRTVRTGNVRAALALVERGEAGAGIVYASDAPIAPRVRILATVPAESHPPIVYPLAIVAGRDRPAVRAFYGFLTGPEAGTVFQAHGFLAPGAGVE
jgi:molybdate transport system substrate-binding protein